MKTKEDFLKEVDDIESKITDLEKQRESVYVEYAEAYCPFKIGDVIVINPGHYPMKKGIIRSISVFQSVFLSMFNKGKLYWRVSGNSLEQDCNEGKNEFEFDEGEYADYNKKIKIILDL